MTIEQIGTISASLFSIVLLISFFIKPYFDKSNKLQNTLTELDITLKLLKKDLEESARDREKIHKILENHQIILDNNKEEITIHEQKIITLFNTIKKGEYKNEK